MTAFNIIVILFSVMLYARIGYQLAKSSLNVEKETNPTKYFFLFPVSFLYKDTWNWVKNTDESSGDIDDPSFYVFSMICGWPIKVLWNAASLCYLWPILAFRAYRAKKQKEEQVKEVSPKERLTKLRREKARIEEEIIGLEAKE